MQSEAPSDSHAGRSFRHRYEGPAYRRLLVGGVRRIPEGVQRAMMPFWAGLFYALVPEARRVVERNIDGVLGEAPLLETRRRSYSLFLHYAQSVANLYRLHLGLPITLEPEFTGRENLDAALARGRGIVSLTGHLGAWQLMPYLIRRGKEVPPMTIAMAEEPNARVSEFEQKYRERLDIVYTTSSPFALLELARVLREGKIVGMQLDRALAGPKVEIPFCGRPAWFPTGAAMLARISGAPMLPIFATYTDSSRRRVTVHYEAPIDVTHTSDRERDLAEGTRRAVDVYERFVRRYPDQWFNFYDFWAGPGESPRP